VRNDHRPGKHRPEKLQSVEVSHILDAIYISTIHGSIYAMIVGFFAGVDAGAAVLHTKEDRGDHLMLLDGFDDFVEDYRIKVFSGQVGVRLQIGHGHLVKPAGHECLSCCHNVPLSADRKDQRLMEPTILRAAGALYVPKIRQLFRMSRNIITNIIPVKPDQANVSEGFRRGSAKGLLSGSTQ
jgi:hypothetical protein